ncbi:winged helix-turn-helix transcriptional regulator [Candidatus Woesearchaeota archaeon]|nr:winged helix-turn-helix transcriptional regulator [Candidatus Woesearchaeota archaeon]
MTEEKFLLLNLEDNKSKELAQVMSSDTARKILNFLANKPLSETEIAEKLSLPLPTVHYNIKQLLNSGIIEIKDFLWSEKGKKIQLYQLANKIIIISPKNSNPSFMEKLKDIIPVALSGFLISAGIYIYQLFNKKFYGYSAERLISGASNSIMQKTSESNISQVGQTTQLVMPSNYVSESTQQISSEIPDISQFAQTSQFIIPNYALWFFLGTLTILVLYIIFIYWRTRKWKK